MKKFFILMAIAMTLFLCACPAKNGTGTATSGASIVTTAETTKTIAEDILYYARVYYNLGKINEAQFKLVRDAYDVVYVAQNQMIDARIAYLKLPTDATADEKYRLAMTQVAIAQQKLIQLALQLGIIKGDVPVVPIR